MSDAKGNQEPSMEEILASIRRIISEDGEPKDEPAAAAVNGHAAEESDEDDALVLTDMVVGESNVVELKEEPVPEQAAAPAAKPVPEPVSPPPIAAVAPLPEPEAAMPEPTPPEATPDIELDENTTELASADDDMPIQPVRAEPPMAPADLPTADIPFDSDLISPDVAAASAATMAQLMARKPQSAQARPTAFDGLLVETLVRQAIEPMLKDWLDEHLQEIVERLVRREVERLSRKAELS